MAYSPASVIFTNLNNPVHWIITATGVPASVWSHVEQQHAYPGGDPLAQTQIEAAKVFIGDELKNYGASEIVKVEASGNNGEAATRSFPRRTLSINIESIDLLPSPTEI